MYVQQGALDKGIVGLRTYFMRPRKSCQQKILSNFAYTGTNKARQGKLVKENLLVVQTRI